MNKRGFIFQKQKQSSLRIICGCYVHAPMPRYTRSNSEQLFFPMLLGVEYKIL